MLRKTVGEKSMGILGLARSNLSTLVRQFGYELVPRDGAGPEPPPQPQQFAHIEPVLRDAEVRAGHNDFDGMLTSLQQLSLGEFANLLLVPPPRFPAMISMLPRMASKDVQLQWTGAHGRALLLQSLLFVKSVETAFRPLCGRPLHGATILDFGCGWGRLLRLMLWFSPPNKIYGVDPWDRSLQICAQDRVPGSRAQSDWIPNTLPFEEIQFDLVYAFSVFTHLSERVALAAQRAIRERIRPDGLLVITIRPVEYWNTNPVHADSQKYRAIIDHHHTKGFAFVPHSRAPVDGEVTYGDTSMTFDYIRENWRAWQMCGYDHNVEDSQQITVFLRPV